VVVKILLKAALLLVAMATSMVVISAQMPVAGDVHVRLGDELYVIDRHGKASKVAQVSPGMGRATVPLLSDGSEFRVGSYPYIPKNHCWSVDGFEWRQVPRFPRCKQGGGRKE
jgi:hypothetical protein